MHSQASSSAATHTGRDQARHVLRLLCRVQLVVHALNHKLVGHRACREAAREVSRDVRIPALHLRNSVQACLCSRNHSAAQHPAATRVNACRHHFTPMHSPSSKARRPISPRPCSRVCTWGPKFCCSLSRAQLTRRCAGGRHRVAECLQAIIGIIRGGHKHLRPQLYQSTAQTGTRDDMEQTCLHVSAVKAAAHLARCERHVGLRMPKETRGGRFGVHKKIHCLFRKCSTSKNHFKKSAG